MTNSTTFLTLPAEIRLRVYDFLLVSRSDQIEFPFRGAGGPYLQCIAINYIPVPKYIEPGIAQTCKQIHHESNTILYSQNVFLSEAPDMMLAFLRRVGLANVKLIKSLRLWVSHRAKLAPWLQLLTLLAKDATGLRYVEIVWSAAPDDPLSLPQRAIDRGLGDNLDFVRALGKIQGLDNLIIKGCYAKNWPAYLERTMAVQVRAVSIEEQCEDMKEMALGHESFREIVERATREFRNFQEGTEDLIP